MEIKDLSPEGHYCSVSSLLLRDFMLIYCFHHIKSDDSQIKKNKTLAVLDCFIIYNIKCSTEYII